MVYEAVLLFGIFFCAGLIFDVSTQKLDPTIAHNARQAYLFIVVGIYFTYFWGRKGQTLAMQTWRIQLVSANRKPLTLKQTWLRYCACWMWFVPAWVVNYAFGIQHWGSIIVLLVGMAAWALTIKLDKNGQFLHDKWAGTELITISKTRQQIEFE